MTFGLNEFAFAFSRFAAAAAAGDRGLFEAGGWERAPEDVVVLAPEAETLAGVLVRLPLKGGMGWMIILILLAGSPAFACVPAGFCVPEAPAAGEVDL